MASTPVALPTAATLQVPSILTKFGALTPDVIQQLQSAFQMDYRTDITLTSAQILALMSTSVTLVPAPGAGLMIIPETVIIRMLGGTQYTDAGGAISFAVGTMSLALAANTIITGPNGATQRSQQVVSFTGTSTAAAPPTNENAALVISKATNNFAAGTGTCHITVFYTIETTT